MLQKLGIESNKCVFLIDLCWWRRAWIYRYSGLYVCDSSDDLSFCSI